MIYLIFIKRFPLWIMIAVAFLCALKSPTKNYRICRMLVYSSRKEMRIYLSFLFLFEWVFISSVHGEHDCKIYCTIIHLIMVSSLLLLGSPTNSLDANIISSMPDTVSRSSRLSVDWNISLCKYFAFKSPYTSIVHGCWKHQQSPSSPHARFDRHSKHRAIIFHLGALLQRF